jgi:putative ABC transport system ATP-binding protein
MTTSALRLKNVSKVFNAGSQDEKRALDGINLEIEPGDFVTIIGSNGAGKSTLLNVIAGTHAPDGGTITIGDRDVTKSTDHKMARYVARVFQDPTMGTAGGLTIEENLSLAERRGLPRRLRWGVTAQQRKRFRQVLKILDLGLETRLKQNAAMLSGGQRQSLTLLMATLSMPRILLLDEHTAALDPRTAEKVSGLTDRIVSEHRLTTLMVTHNMNQALRFGNRMVMLHQGRTQMDVAGEAKNCLSVRELVEKFGKSLKDETLLACDPELS